jgi:hypothetical protein
VSKERTRVRSLLTSSEIHSPVRRFTHQFGDAGGRVVPGQHGDHPRSEAERGLRSSHAYVVRAPWLWRVRGGRGAHRPGPARRGAPSARGGWTGGDRPVCASRGACDDAVGLASRRHARGDRPRRSHRGHGARRARSGVGQRPRAGRADRDVAARRRRCDAVAGAGLPGRVTRRAATARRDAGLRLARAASWSSRRRSRSSSRTGRRPRAERP